MRKTYSKDLKFKVAIEAVRSDLTIAEIISKYKISQALLHSWKKQLLEEGNAVFDRKKYKNKEPQDVEKLYAKIGQLTLERDFFHKALSKPQ